ncbi:plectin-like isoform X1 [Arapaima gigas]
MVAGMLMPLEDLGAIYELLFRDGVLVAKKDKRPQSKHPEIQGVTNLQVMRAMGSLKSRGYVRETFAWKHFYWYVTNAGIEYLRGYLHLPPEIVPSSLQRVRRPGATLDVKLRAARMQTVEGLTAYAPKPIGRGCVETQESVKERQAYRHKMETTARERNSEATLKHAVCQLRDEEVSSTRKWENKRKEAGLVNGSTPAAGREGTQLELLASESPRRGEEDALDAACSRPLFL